MWTILLECNDKGDYTTGETIVPDVILFSVNCLVTTSDLCYLISYELSMIKTRHPSVHLYDGKANEVGCFQQCNEITLKAYSNSNVES